MSRFSEIWKPRSLVVVLAIISKEGISFYAQKPTIRNAGEPLDMRYFASVSEIVKHFGNSQAYWLHVQGSGILTRLVDRPEGYHEDLIVSGDKTDFFFSSYTDGERSLVSFFRKKVVEEVVKEFGREKAHLFSCSSGPIPELIDLVEGKISTNSSDYIIELKQGKLISLTKREEHTIFSQQNSKIASAILNLFLSPNEHFNFSSKNDIGANALENFSQQKKFQILGLVSVFFILFLLIGNYFYTNSLNQSIVQLEEELALNNGNLSLMDELKGERTRKHQLVENSGFLGNNYISFYLDKIGKSVPSMIDLDQLYVFPLEEKLKEKRKVTVQKQRVEINGITVNNAILDDWIEKLNRFEWVERVELLHYMNEADNKAVFKILVILNK
jgi:Tfp pilus assembly protein PilN